MNRSRKTTLNKVKPINSWANSKIGLLVIGAIISGVLIPGFQYTQRFFEWKRDNQYGYYAESLKNHKLLLRRFIESRTYLAESHEVMLGFYMSKNKNKINREQLLKKITKIQSQRFKTNTEISFLILETGNKNIETEYSNFTKLNQQHILKTKEVISKLNENQMSAEMFDDLSNSLQVINKSYESLKNILSGSVQETIDKNEYFNLF